MPASRRPAAPAALCATPGPRPVPSPALLAVGAVPRPPDVALSRPRAVAPVVAARVSVKSALAPSSSPVRVFVLLSSGCGGVCSSFNCLRRASVDLFVVASDPVFTHTKIYKRNPKKPNPQKEQQQNPNPATASNTEGSGGRK